MHKADPELQLRFGCDHLTSFRGILTSRDIRLPSCNIWRDETDNAFAA
jgi:hypothetical protein